MNFLAHLHLAGKNDGIIIGNILEDFISGRVDGEKLSYLPADIKNGLRLHRIIDTFTDSNTTVKKSKLVFQKEFGKFSSIIVDVVFDHFLQKNWDNFSTEKFDEFIPRVHKSLLTGQLYQPEEMKNMVKSMVEYNWLKNYIHFWGLERAFKNLNSRIKIANIDLTLSIPILQDNYTELEYYFLEFYPALAKETNDFLKNYDYING